MSESFLLTSDIERNSSTIFSRFNGYTDFTIRGDVFELFSECNDTEKRKKNSKFQICLENFIWLFFRGQNLIENDNVIEFLQADVSDFGGYGHEPSIVM